MEHFFIFSIYWEFHHPNWGTHICQRGRSTTNQITYLLSYIYRDPMNNPINSPINNPIYHIPYIPLIFSKYHPCNMAQKHFSASFVDWKRWTWTHRSSWPGQISAPAWTSWWLARNDAARARCISTSSSMQWLAGYLTGPFSIANFWHNQRVSLGGGSLGI